MSYTLVSRRLIAVHALTCLLATLLTAACAPRTAIRQPEPQQRRATTTAPAESYRLFLEGVYRAQHEDLAGAIRVLEPLMRRHPQDTTVARYLLSVHIMAEHFDRARQILDQLREAEPHNDQLIILSARLAAEQHRLDDALRLLATIPRDSQSYTDALQYRIRITWQQGAHATARDLLCQYLALCPDDPEGYFYMGRLLDTHGPADQAARWYARALQHDPAYGDAHQALAQWYATRGRTDQALAQYCQGLAAVPDNLPLREAYALLLVNNERFAQAIAQYRCIGNQHPSYAPVAATTIGLIHYEQRAWQPAIDAFRQALSLDPDNDRAHYYLGNALLQTDEPAAAAGHFSAVSAESTLRVNARGQLAVIRHMQGDDAAAEQLLRTLLQSHPDSLVPCRLLTSLLDELQRTDDAIAVTEHCLHTRGDLPELLYLRGSLEDKAGRFEQAIATMRRIVAVDPDHADALNFIGYSFADRGINLEEAESLIRRALEQEPDNGYIVDSLGWVLYRTGRLREARRQLLRAIDLVGGDPVIYEHLGDVYASMGRTEAAIDAYRNAIQRDSGLISARQKLDRLLRNESDRHAPAQ